MKLLFITLICWLLAESAAGKVNQLFLEVGYMPTKRDWMITDSTGQPRIHWDYSVSSLFDVSLYDTWFMSSKLMGGVMGGKFRSVEWDFTHGIHITPWLDVIHDHRSSHVIDWELDRFEVRDSYGVRINFHD